MQEIIQSTSIPLDILKHAIRAEVIYHKAFEHYEFDLSIFFNHYTTVMTEAEYLESKHPYQLIRSKWLDCLAQFHEELKLGKKENKKLKLGKQ